MNHKRAFSGFSFLIVTLVALDLATPASATPVDYRAVITAQIDAGATVGYVADDPAYWTPLLTPTSVGALIVDFRLDGTSGSQINLTPKTRWRGVTLISVLLRDETARVPILDRAVSTTYISATPMAQPRVRRLSSGEITFQQQLA